MRHVFNHLQYFAQKNSSEAVSKLNADFHMLKSMISVAHLDRLSAAAVGAFSRRFPGSKIDCLPKSSGVQFGTRVRLILDCGDCRTYYVKTHADGRLFSNSAAAKVVEPGELLVYKVLEMTGYGCESLFFKETFRIYILPHWMQVTVEALIYSRVQQAVLIAKQMCLMAKREERLRWLITRQTSNRKR